MCIEETGHSVEYTGGASLWAGAWNVRLASWPDRTVLASQLFRFEPPAVLGTGEGFDPSLPELCFRWLTTGIKDTTVKTYPGILESISPDFKRMILWLEDTQSYELWDVETATKLDALTENANYFKSFPRLENFRTSK